MRFADQNTRAVLAEADRNTKVAFATADANVKQAIRIAGARMQEIEGRLVRLELDTTRIDQLLRRPF